MTQPIDGANQSEEPSATENATLRAENTALKDLIRGLQARIAEL
jgi:hypothetical protein